MLSPWRTITKIESNKEKKPRTIKKKIRIGVINLQGARTKSQYWTKQQFYCTKIFAHFERINIILADSSLCFSRRARGWGGGEVKFKGGQSISFEYKHVFVSFTTLLHKLGLTQNFEITPDIFKLKHNILLPPFYKIR